MKIPHSALLLLTLVAATAAAADRPNIVFMMSDDQAWNGLSVAMHPELRVVKEFDCRNAQSWKSWRARACVFRRPMHQHRFVHQLESVCRRVRVRPQCTGPRRLPRSLGHKMIEPRNIRQLDRGRSNDRRTALRVPATRRRTTASGTSMVVDRPRTVTTKAMAKSVTNTLIGTAIPTQPTYLAWLNVPRHSWKRARRPTSRSSFRCHGTHCMPRRMR